MESPCLPEGKEPEDGKRLQAAGGIVAQRDRREGVRGGLFPFIDKLWWVVVFFAVFIFCMTVLSGVDAVHGVEVCGAGSGPDGPVDRLCDIFPVPYLPAVDASPCSGPSRTTRRRREHKAHVTSWIHDAISTRTVLGGRGGPVGGGGVAGAGIRTAVDQVVDTFHKHGAPLTDMCSDGALRELLGTSGFNSHDRADVKSYNKDLVSWPPTGTRPAGLLGCFREADREALHDWQRPMLRDPVDFAALVAETGGVRPH